MLMVMRLFVLPKFLKWKQPWEFFVVSIFLFSFSHCGLSLWKKSWWWSCSFVSESFLVVAFFSVFWLKLTVNKSLSLTLSCFCYRVLYAIQEVSKLAEWVFALFLFLCELGFYLIRRASCLMFVFMISNDFFNFLLLFW